MGQDERCNSAVARVTNRKYVTEKVKVGCAPIMNIDEVFADKHVLARGMKFQMDVPAISAAADLIGSPMKFSESKVDYRIPPPRLGEHTNLVLESVGYSVADIKSLQELGAV